MQRKQKDNLVLYFQSFCTTFLLKMESEFVIETLYFIFRMIAYIQQKTKAWIQRRVVLMRLWTLYTTPASETMKMLLIKN